MPARYTSRRYPITLLVEPKKNVTLAVLRDDQFVFFARPGDDARRFLPDSRVRTDTVASLEDLRLRGRSSGDWVHMLYYMFHAGSGCWFEVQPSEPLVP